jgi:hypothetical protein
MRYVLAALAAVFALSFDIKLQREQFRTGGLGQVPEIVGSAEFASGRTEKSAALSLRDGADALEAAKLQAATERLANIAARAKKRNDTRSSCLRVASAVNP